MKTLSLKLDDSIFQDTERVLLRLKKTRNRYINEAIQYYNRLQKKRLLAHLMETESILVNEESLKILAEFDKLEDYDY